MSDIRRWKIGPHAPFADGDTPELKHQFVVLLSDHEAALNACDVEIAKLKACVRAADKVKHAHEKLRASCGYKAGTSHPIQEFDAARAEVEL